VTSAIITPDDPHDEGAVPSPLNNYQTTNKLESYLANFPSDTRNIGLHLKPIQLTKKRLIISTERGETPAFPTSPHQRTISTIHNKAFSSFNKIEEQAYLLLKRVETHTFPITALFAVRNGLFNQKDQTTGDLHVLHHRFTRALHQAFQAN
jgi:hypothetical protein